MNRSIDTCTAAPVSWPGILTVFTGAFALRFAAALIFPNLLQADEIYQSLELAHRLVFGNGIITWEFREGARSWLLPGLLAGMMKIGAVLAPGSRAYLHMAQGLICALSATTAAIGYVWGSRFGRAHGIFAAVALASWSELVYFGSKAFSEVIGGAFLFAGVWLCSASAKRDTRHSAFAGLLLGLAFVFRFHLAPAILVTGIWREWRDTKQGRVAFLTAAAIPVIVLGILDWATWGEPFASIYRNFTANVVRGVASGFGVQPPTYFFHEIAHRWGGALAVLGLLAIKGARRELLPLVVAAVIIAAYTAIGHKEYRFIYPAIPLIVMLAAIGTGDLYDLLRPVDASTRFSLATCLLLAGGWIATSLILTRPPDIRAEWYRARGGLELLWRAGLEARCGVGIEGVEWWVTGAYTYLHRDIPVHLFSPTATSRGNRRAVDVMLSLPEQRDQQDPDGFAQESCLPQETWDAPQLCLRRRTGACEEDVGTLAQHMIESRAQ